MKNKYKLSKKKKYINKNKMKKYIQILVLLVTLVICYDLEQVERDLSNNKVKYHSRRILEESEGTVKPIWEPMRIKYIFEQPFLALGDSYLNRLV